MKKFFKCYQCGTGFKKKKLHRSKLIGSYQGDKVFLDYLECPGCHWRNNEFINTDAIKSLRFKANTLSVDMVIMKRHFSDKELKNKAKEHEEILFQIDDLIRRIKVELLDEQCG